MTSKLQLLKVLYKIKCFEENKKLATLMDYVDEITNQSIKYRR